MSEGAIIFMKTKSFRIEYGQPQNSSIEVVNNLTTKLSTISKIIKLTLESLEICGSNTL